MAVLQAVKELLPLNPLYSEELKQYIANFNPNQPSQLADFSAALTTASGEKLQEILDTLPLQSRMQKVLELLRKSARSPSCAARSRIRSTRKYRRSSASSFFASS
jgi:ATP-dependent Lon protease